MREELDIPMPSMGPSYRTPRRRAAMDPNTKRLMVIAGGIGGTLLLLVGGWSMTGGHRGGVPVVEADSRPLRVKPDNPGGLQVAGQDESIMGGSSASTTQATLAPAPEAPALQALRAQEQQRVAAATAPAAPVMPAQPVSLTTMQSAEAPHPSLTAPVAPRPATTAVVRQAPAAPRPVIAAGAKPAPAAARPVVAARGAQVQLAALTSEQAAMTEWQRLEKKDPALFGGRKPSVVKVEHDGKVFWRLRTGGFSDVAEANGFCDRIKSKGAGCSVTSS